MEPTTVASLLVMLATEANEHRLIENRPVIEASFGQRAEELATPAPGHPERGVGSAVRRAVAMVDPRSRRRGWLIAPRVMGRRSRVPYADYADFMQTIRSRGTGRR